MRWVEYKVMVPSDVTPVRANFAKHMEESILRVNQPNSTAVLSILALLFFLLSTEGLSQSLMPVLVAKRDIGIFTAPRNGLFCQRGKMLGRLKSGTELSEYEVIKSYCGLFLKYDYLRITFTTPDGKKVPGYIHRTDDDGTDRFEKVR